MMFRARARTRYVVSVVRLGRPSSVTGPNVTQDGRSGGATLSS